MHTDEWIKELESELPIRFQDCDPFGHLNNARYFDYFFNARDDQTLQYYGYGPLKISQEFGANWVVTHHQISYLKPAMFGEIVVLRTALIHFDHNSTTVEGIMLNREKNVLKSLLWTTLRNVSMETGRSTSHSPELMTMLQRMLKADSRYTPSGFHDRLQELKEYFKQLSQG
jgi:acyl-CoA thioester hydrolase